MQFRFGEEVEGNRRKIMALWADSDEAIRWNETYIFYLFRSLFILIPSVYISLTLLYWLIESPTYTLVEILYNQWLLLNKGIQYFIKWISQVRIW